MRGGLCFAACARVAVAEVALDRPSVSTIMGLGLENFAEPHMISRAQGPNTVVVAYSISTCYSLSCNTRSHPQRLISSITLTTTKSNDTILSTT